MPEDTRKTYILTTIANYFGFDYDSVESLSDHRTLSKFLDDANCSLLSATRGHKNSVHLSNEIKVTEGSQTLVQFKLRPDVITPENVHTNIFVSSMIDSPIDSLRYVIKSVFAPALRKGNSTVESSLNEAEQIVAEKTATIFHPNDEIRYWIDVTKNSTKNKDVERAKYFLEVFNSVKTDFDNLEK